MATKNKKLISENSTVIIHLNIKTLLYILGVLISIYGTGFYFLNDKLNGVGNNINQIKKEDIEILKTQTSKIDGQMQILLQMKHNNNNHINQ